MDPDTWHALLVTGHAVSATVAFGAGLVLLLRGRLTATYLVALVAMAGFLVAALAVGWSSFPDGARVVFLALVALAAAVVVQGFVAVRMRDAVAPGVRAGFVERVGFTLIALFDGFAVVTVLNATGSGLLAAVAGTFGVVAGRRLLRSAHRRDACVGAVAVADHPPTTALTRGDRGTPARVLT